MAPCQVLVPNSPQITAKTALWSFLNFQSAVILASLKMAWIVLALRSEMQ